MGFRDEKRLYPRYALRDRSLGSADIEGESAVITEIAYGGAGLELQRPFVRMLQEGDLVRISLHILGRSHELLAEVVSLQGVRLSLCFMHAQTADLYFLRDVIEWIEAGIASQGDSPEAGNTALTGRFGVRIETGLAGAGLVIAFRDRLAEFHLNLEGGELVTLHNIDRGAERGPMRETRNPDFDITRKGLLILQGAWLASGDERFRAVFEEILSSTGLFGPRSFRAAG